MGGSALNTAYFLKNLLDCSKFKILPVGLVGNDSHGETILAKLKEKGFDTGSIKKIEGNSGHTSIILDKDGERTINRFKSVNSELDIHIKEILDRIFKPHDFVHVKISLRVLEKVFEITNELFSADISGFLTGKDTAGGDVEIKNIIQGKSVRILFGNWEEYKKLAKLLNYNFELNDAQDPASCKEYFEKLQMVFSSEYIFIKQGSNGASLFYNSEFIHFEAPKVNVVDTTGAGDAFNAGAIYAMLSGVESIENILKNAIETGSMNCTVFGGQEFKNFEELKKKIDKYY